MSDRFLLVARAFADHDFEAAAEHAALAAEEAPGSRLNTEAARYLERVAKGERADVYGFPEAFAAFIRAGGNIPLYETLVAALRSRYAAHRPATLLDIGAGDGRALLPAIQGFEFRRVDVLEPSQPLLSATVETLRRRRIEHRALATTVQDLLKGAPRWSLAQATFSLSALPPADRRHVLEELSRHTDRLLIAEFDVPAQAAPLDPAWVHHLRERYELGLAEYPGPLVAQGFLMPVLFGLFDRTSDRVVYEQPIQSWRTDLENAGFEVSTQHLYDYWWAPAYLLDAKTTRRIVVKGLPGRVATGEMTGAG